MQKTVVALLLIAGLGVSSNSFADGWGETSALNTVEAGIEGTRHNLTQSFLGGVISMEDQRNNYGEVCVYCHTPHGANTTPNALGMPLWNRTINYDAGTYELYNMTTTLQLMGQQHETVSKPGPASLTCLSCHDGITAIDSIINMPGSGRYKKSQEDASTIDEEFLDTWTNLGGLITVPTHRTLEGCANKCHNDGSSPTAFGGFVIGRGDSEVYQGKDVNQLTKVDLSNDHPVGVLYPTTFEANVDFSEPNGEIPGKMRFFERSVGTNRAGRADKNEIRLYDSGEGYEVECASCHDPHGVPDSGGVKFIPSFLRVENAGSQLCLTCHIK